MTTTENSIHAPTRLRFVRLQKVAKTSAPAPPAIAPSPIPMQRHWDLEEGGEKDLAAHVKKHLGVSLEQIHNAAMGPNGDPSWHSTWSGGKMEKSRGAGLHYGVRNEYGGAVANRSL